MGWLIKISRERDRWQGQGRGEFFKGTGVKAEAGGRKGGGGGVNTGKGTCGTR